MRKYIKIVLFATFISLSSPVTSVYNKSSFVTITTVSNEKVDVIEEKKESKESPTHIATWYNLHGNRTASGERFHKDSLTAAYNYVKLGTYLKVTNINNEESVIVKVTDRMGNKSPNRIDLSISAFDSIANLSSGKAKVLIEVIK